MTATLFPAPSRTIVLRPYQESAIEAFLAGAKRGLRRMLIVLPTGCGKTIMGIAMAKRLGARTLWLAHREELIRQPLEAAEHVWPGATCGVVKAESNTKHGDFIVGCLPTLWRADRMRDLRQSASFGLIVFDESHHAASESNMKALEELGVFTPDGPLLLGITATPERTDRKALDAFEEIVFRLGLLEAIEQGYLAPFRSKQVQIDLKLENVALTKAGDLNEEDLDRELKRAGAAEATARAIVEHASDRKTVVFTVSVDQAERTAACLESLGIAAEAVSYNTPATTRKAILARFHKGTTKVLANAFLLSEGYDEPAVDCVAMARPTKSQPLYQQAVGRGLRLFPGKTDLLILDLVGASDLGLVTADRMVQALERERAGLPREGEPRETGDTPPAESFEDKLVASYLAVATGGKGSARVSWIEVEKGLCWALAAGEHGTIVLLRSVSPLDTLDPARKFLAQLRDALAAKRCHARGVNANRCPWPRSAPERFGWTGRGKNSYTAANSPRIAWVDEEDFYLDMTAAREVTRSTLANPGESLLAAGLLVASQPDQANGAIVKTLQGEERRVFYLRTKDVLAPPPEAQEGAPEVWRAELLPRNKATPATPIGDPGALDWAFGLAEDYARALRVLKLSANDAGWRVLAATEPQKNELDRRRIAHGSSLTRGEAADLLTAAVVRFRVLGGAK